MLHIGKTGGTALKHPLHQQPGTRQYVIFLHPHRIRLRFEEEDPEDSRPDDVTPSPRT